MGQRSVVAGASGHSRASAPEHSGRVPGKVEAAGEIVGVHQDLHDTHRCETSRVRHAVAVVRADLRTGRTDHGNQQRAARVHHLYQPGGPRGAVRVHGGLGAGPFTDALERDVAGQRRCLWAEREGVGEDGVADVIGGLPAGAGQRAGVAVS